MSVFLQACRREPTPYTPIWIMRQAGRYLPEYMAIRSKVTFLELCKRPDLAAEVTLTAQQVLGVDAAILFADLLPILEPMGLELEYQQGEGPVIHNPVRSPKDVERLNPVDVHDSLGYVGKAASMVRSELGQRIPLIGFAGAPFTLASYAIEGGTSRNHILTKRFMYSEPDAWHKLLEKLSRIVAAHLIAQVEAGASAVQLFDSWVGHLGPNDYREFVMPHSRAIFEGVSATGVPTIHFGVMATGLLSAMSEAGGDVVGLDWRIPLDEGRRLVGNAKAVQGNLDPVALFAPRDQLRQRVHDILDTAGGRPGHIFNLGHGILPETPVDNVKYVVELVHEYRR